MLGMLEAINDVVYTTYTQAVKFKTIKEILRGKGYDGPYSDEMRSDRSPYQDIKLHNAGEDGG